MRVIVVLWCLVFNPALAAEYLSHQLDQNQVLMIQTDQGVVTLTARSEASIEVLYHVNDIQQLPSFALLPNKINVHPNVKDNSDSVTFQLPKITAVIKKSPFQIAYYSEDKSLIEEEKGGFVFDGLRGFRFRLAENEKLFGGGQRIVGMDRRGHRFPLYNRAHYGYTTESNQMYFGLPAVMSNRGYALIFDNSAKGNLDIGAAEADILQFDAIAGRLAYIVIAGDNYPQLIANLTQITGRQPLPPRWALGNFASRFGYRTQQETLDTAQRFIDLDVPLDAIVLDLYWFGKDIKGHMGNLDWDKEAFPTPQNMMADLNQKGVNTVLITEPFVLTTSKKWQDAVEQNALAKNINGQPKQYEFYFGNTGLIDVFSAAGQRWFVDVYTKLSQQGVTGWWGDLGEPEVHPYDLIHNFNGLLLSADTLHNVYGHKWAEMVYSNQLQVSPNTRPMLLMRSGFIGSQRYGMIPWTGDVSRSWGGLKPQVELSLQMSLFGLAYTHSDLGGFAGGEQFDQELYLRWLQYGVFQPVYRPHAQENIAPEPVFHDQTTLDIARKFIKLRYAMLPYNYSLAYENSLFGMPLMRPMAFVDETNTAYFDMSDQFFWGESFLVKPITDPKLTAVDVLLPEGIWFDFWNDSSFVGGQSVSIKTPLDTLPVLVKAGAFIPMHGPMQNTKQYSTEKLDIHYYYDPSVAQSSYVLYDDDGIDPNSIELGQYQQIKAAFNIEDGHYTFTFSSDGAFTSAPEQRQFTLVIHNWQDTKIAKIVQDDSVIIPVTGPSAQLSSGKYLLNKASKTLQIQFLWKKSTKIQIF